jgi:phosphopantothenoylcysteine synthetase/decarboxylase
MGYAIAEAALAEAHEIMLISGPAESRAAGNATLIPVSTSDEMFEAVHRYADECDICVLCAAVADYKPVKVSSTKIKKRGAKFSLELVPTRDILDSLGHKQDRQFVLVGFAAETDHVEENAAKKLRAKNCDIIVANDVSSADSGNGERRERSDNFVSKRRKRENFSGAKKKYRARARKNIFKFRNKNV